MTPVSNKVRHALAEGVILMSVVEALIGFGFNAFFQPGFGRLPPETQVLKFVGLVALLVSMGLILAPVTFHHIAARGEATPGVHRFASVMLGLGLVPFAAGSSADIYVLIQKMFDTTAAALAAVAACGFMLFCWYGWEWNARRRMAQSAAPNSSMPEKQKPEDPEQKLKSKIDQVLEEVRMVLPGAQALLGFQFIAILTNEFELLPQSSKLAHLASQGAIGLAAVLLMTPAAYHRIVEDGETTERFFRVAQRMLALAMIPLALGVSIDMYVVAAKLTDSATFGLGTAMAALLMFFGLWYGYSYYRRWREAARPTEAPQPAR